MNKVLITHNDFDGVTCAILFKTAYPEGIYYLENYDTVDKRIASVLGEAPQCVYITDISPQTKVVAEMLDKYSNFASHFAKIALFDHHKTALHLNSYSWATVDTTKCGAWLFYEYLRSLPKPDAVSERLEDLSPLVFHANDYDLWLHKDPHSSILNSLLFIYGQDRFINRFLENPSIELTETEKLLIEIETERQGKYIEEAAKTAVFYSQFKDVIIAVVCAERYISALGDYLLNLDLPNNRKPDIVAIVNAQKNTVSLRSRKWDVSAIAKACGGGGHENAAGFQLEDRWLQDDVAELVQMYATLGEK